MKRLGLILFMLIASCATTPGIDGPVAHKYEADGESLFVIQDWCGSGTRDHLAGRDIPLVYPDCRYRTVAVTRDEYAAFEVGDAWGWRR